MTRTVIEILDLIHHVGHDEVPAVFGKGDPVVPAARTNRNGSPAAKARFE